MKKYGLLILLAGTAVMIVVMAKTGAPLKTPATPNGILNLEFAYSAAKASEVKQAWLPVENNADNITAATINTYLDFIFLFFYALFLFFTCDKMARITKSRVGTLVANGALYAGLLDVAENTGMLMTLSGTVSGTTAFITTFCSVIKWALALAAVLYLIAGSIQLLVQKKFRLLLA